MIQTHGTSMTSAHYSRLGPQECEKIHMASLEILAHIGVDVHDQKALDILVDTGSSVLELALFNALQAIKDAS